MLGKRLGSQELADLAVYLRQQSFPVGATQVEAAQRLLWRMAEQGVSKPAAELRPWLGPIFATNARDLDRFADLYAQWQLSTCIQAPPPPPKHKWKLLCWLTIGILGTALAVVVGIREYRLKGNAVTQVPPLKGKGGSIETIDASSGVATAAGLLRGDDGKPVAHVRLLYAGQVSESSNKGEFSVTGRSFEPVLASHCDYDAVLFPIISRTDYDLRMVRKSHSACTPGHVSSGPDDPRPRYRHIRLAASATPMFAFLVWTTYVLWKRVGLRKWRGAANSRFAQVPLGDSADRVFPETDLQRSVQELRRPRPIPWRDLWPEPTVTATVENGGWFTPVYHSRQRAAEYLVLIDRSGKRDQQARFADELLSRLKARGVYAQVCYFNSDPRTCTETETGQSVPITDLSARFGQCQVWIVADSSIFFNAFTGRLERWVDLFQQWPSRLLLTPAGPTDWGDREVGLSDLGFEIVAASPRGLARIVKHLGTSDVALDSYPPLLEERPTRWTSSEPPTERETARLWTELRLYLGRDGFRWLAACAEYPLIEWPLTLYLGNVLMQPEKQEATLRKLVRLPWFRSGSMPNWLRVSLSKDKNLRKHVHQLFLDRLNAMRSRPEHVEGDEVEVAIERDYQRRINEDEIWLSLLWGRDSGGLALPASGLRRLLFQRGRVWLGPRLAALFASAVLSSSCIWWVMGFGVPSFNPPQPQVESIALDVAMSQYPGAAYFKAEYSSNKNVQFPDWCYQITQLLLGHFISLSSPSPGATPIPGTISRRNSDKGLYAGSGWSLVFQGDHIVAQKDYPVYQSATLSTGTLPDIPAAPRYDSGDLVSPPPLWSRPEVSIIVPSSVASVSGLIRDLRNLGYTVKANAEAANHLADPGSIDYSTPNITTEDRAAAKEIEQLASLYGWTGTSPSFHVRTRRQVAIWYPHMYGSAVGIDSQTFSISGSFENGYSYDPASTVTIDLQTGLVVSANVVIKPTGERFSSNPTFRTSSMWQWQNRGTLKGSLDFQDKKHTFINYPGGVLTHAAYWTPSLGRNVVSANTVLATSNAPGLSESAVTPQGNGGAPILTTADIQAVDVKPSGRNLDLLLRYTFSGECQTCFLQATLVSADQERANVNDRLQLSPGTRDVGLIVTNSAGTSFVSNEIQICMVDDRSTKPLLCKQFPFTYKWAPAGEGGGLLAEPAAQSQASGDRMSDPRIGFWRYESGGFSGNVVGTPSPRLYIQMIQGQLAVTECDRYSDCLKATPKLNFLAGSMGSRGLEVLPDGRLKYTWVVRVAEGEGSGLIYYTRSDPSSDASPSPESTKSK